LRRNRLPMPMATKQDVRESKFTKLFSQAGSA
jgi:hypothetical protein